jgi:hypothetical protein
MLTKRRLTANKASRLRPVADYFFWNRNRMACDVYPTNGWPNIERVSGKGLQEPCPRSLRKERGGLLPPRSHAQDASHLPFRDFNEYCDFHIQRDQQRLYPSFYTFAHE